MRIMDWSSDVCSSDLAAIAGVLSFPLHANAQDTNPAPGTPVTDLTKVTVSASTSRLPDSDAALPNTITVITAEELREQLAVTRDLSQVLANLIPAFAPSRQKMSSFGESLRGRQDRKSTRLNSSH